MIDADNVWWFIRAPDVLESAQELEAQMSTTDSLKTFMHTLTKTHTPEHTHTLIYTHILHLTHSHSHWTPMPSTGGHRADIHKL